MLLPDKSPSPLYLQIYSEIKKRIISGIHREGEALSSVRRLSLELNVSKKTVAEAYELLASEGYVESRSRKGYFVSGLFRDVSGQEQFQSRTEGNFDPGNHSFRYDFHPGRLDDSSFPAGLWSRLQNEVFRDHETSMSFYTNPQGELRLRIALCEYLRRSRGVLCDPDRLVITSGLKESLTLISDLLSDRVKTVAIEDPGYRVPYLIFERRYRIKPVPLDTSGIKIEALRKTKAGAVYITPSHQSPMGIVMDLKRREELILWSRSTGAFLIEDDYDAELRYNGLPIPSLQGLFPAGNIFYAGSVSKVLSPALRVGYLVLPESMLESYKKLKFMVSTSVPLPVQATLTRFMEKGHWDGHILKMRVLYKKKHDAIIAAIQKHMGQYVEITGQGAGLHIVLRLHQHRPEADLISSSRKHGIGLHPLSHGYRFSKGFDGLVAPGFGGMPLEELDRAVSDLGKIWFGV